jgi:hypothetical protein
VRPTRCTRWAAGVATVLAIGLAAGGASDTLGAGGRVAPACSNETVYAGEGGGYTAACGQTGPRAASWHAVARKVRFPLYAPTRTLGLTTSGPAIYPCQNPPMPRRLVQAIYTGAHGAQFAVREMYPEACGNADEGNVVARPTIHGVTASLLVNCREPCRVTAADGFENGFQLYWRERGTRRTWIEMFAHHLRKRQLLKAARSVTRVR